MKKLILVLVMMLVFAMCWSTDPPTEPLMTDIEMENIMKTSSNWSSFKVELNKYVIDEGIQAWDFHDQVTAFLQDDVGPQTISEAFNWWSTDGWYEENQIEWVWPWGLWYIKFTEKYNGAQWA